MTERHPAEDIEGIEMLSEPLLTDDGFLNEACMRQLAAAIRNMPESYERLSGEPEWNTPYPVSDAQILGAFAYSAVRHFNGAPPGLAEVINYVRACLLRGAFADAYDCNEFRITDLSLCDINRELWSYLRGLKQFEDWNKKEVVGPNWLDLSALLHSVCIEIRNDRRHAHAFDRDFDKKYKHLENDAER